MRVAWFPVVPLALSSAVDDSTILLSVSRAEAQVGAGQRLTEVVGQHNVTQLASFIEEMSEVELQGDGVTSEIRTALTLIRNNVLGTIVTGLKSEHDADQHLVDNLNKCMEKCNQELADSNEADMAISANSFQLMIDHNVCRTDVHAKYAVKISKCEELDSWIAGLRWPGGIEQECVWGNPDDKVGTTFQFGMEWYKNHYTYWESKHKACVLAVKDYDEADADCDHKQMLFEVASCSVASAMQSTCTDSHQTCCSQCAATFHKTLNEVECREKDRKIDYSAVTKIECYLDILMTSPSDEEIKEKCDKDQCTASDWRLAKYADCHFECEDVDYESGEYAEIDGVNTTHRHENPEVEKRCTREYDVDFPAMVFCDFCTDPPVSPCSEAWLEANYMRFQQTVHTPNVDDGTKFCPCSGLHDIPIPSGAPYGEGECPTTHEEWYAYSLAKCGDCPSSPDPAKPDCDFYGDEVLVMVREQNLKIGEIIVKGPNGVVKLEATMSSNHQSRFYYADRCVDGDVETSCRASGRVNTRWLSVRLPEPQCISTVEVHNIETCNACPDHVVGAHISLVDRGMLVWRSAFDAHQQDTYVWHMSDVDRSLIAEFPLDSNCNSPHGGFQGSAPQGWDFAPGIKGNALSLTDSQYCMVDELRNFHWGHGFSACAWTKRTDSSGYMGIIGNGYYTEGSWEIRVGREGCDSGTCTMLGGGVVSTMEDEKATWDVKGVQMTMNEWHHVCMTYNGRTVKFYVDKELQGSENRDLGPIEMRDLPFFIGSASPQREPFHGLIDQVRLYRRTLTPSDVAMVYNLDTAHLED